MTSRPWWKDAKIYELYVNKFAVDFKGLTARLDYFTFLGINTLHILPHYPSSLIDGGYDISDYKAVRASLGSLDDFACFCEAARSRNIRVIVDLVLNHVSIEHPWFVEARESKHNLHRNFFIWSETGKEYAGAPNPFVDFKKSNWISNEQTGDFYYATFYPEQPDLNWRNSAILPEFTSIMDFWVSKGVSGFRLDAVPYLIKGEDGRYEGLPKTHAVLRKLRDYLDKKYGDIVLLAEVAGTVEVSRTYFGDDDECQLVYHFPLMREMFLALARGNTQRIQELARRSISGVTHGTWAVFLRNHDEVSLDTLPEQESEEVRKFIDPDGLYPFRNGTTAAVRLGTIFENNPTRLIEAFKLLYSQSGAPIMYYGDEIGMKNLPLHPNIKDTRHYVRGAFDWNFVEQMLADKNSLLHQTARIIHGNAVR